MGVENRRHIFEHRSTTQDKDAFIHPDKGGDGKRYRGFGDEDSPTYINFRAQTSNETLRSVDISRLSQSSTASSTVRCVKVRSFYLIFDSLPFPVQVV